MRQRLITAAAYESQLYILDEQTWSKRGANVEQTWSKREANVEQT